MCGIIMLRVKLFEQSLVSSGYIKKIKPLFRIKLKIVID